jgi:hypothetical protein
MKRLEAFEIEHFVARTRGFSRHAILAGRSS